MFTMNTTYRIASYVLAACVAGTALAAQLDSGRDRQPATPPVTEPAKRPAAASEKPAAAKPVRREMEWTIDGTKRTAIVIGPDAARRSVGSGSGIEAGSNAAPAAASSLAPVIFAFHGHGGNARYSERRFAYHTIWPEAICIYMQGIPTPSKLVDPEGKRNRWQNVAGIHNDRDLAFFDAVLATIRKEYRVDDARIYATGHSNGGGFTYLLWAERAEQFAAFAPAAAGAAGARLKLSVGGKLTPKPAMHIAGRNDPLVKFAFQEGTMKAVRELNGCDEKGAEWAENCLKYESKTGTPFIAMITDGAHEFPAAAPELIVKFFKEHRKPEPAKTPGAKPAMPASPDASRPSAKP